MGNRALQENPLTIVAEKAETSSDGLKAFPLSLARKNEKLRIVAFLTGKGLDRRLGDLGLHKGSVVQVLHRERSGASIVVHDNNRVAIGAGVAQMVSVALCEDKISPDCDSCERA